MVSDSAGQFSLRIGIERSNMYLISALLFIVVGRRPKPPQQFLISPAASLPRMFLAGIPCYSTQG